MNRLLLSLIILCGCQASTAPVELPPITGTAARQYHVAGAPSIVRHSHPDSSVLFVRVTTRDSMPHRTWTPTRLRIESNLGHNSEIILVPFACLDPSERSGSFPLNFTWEACHWIGLDTDRVLSSADVERIQEIVNGRLTETYEFRTLPGASYRFEVPIGRDATAEAASRVSSLPNVVRAFRDSREPSCVTSDRLPPPTCPPWTLDARLPFTFDPQAAATAVLTSHGGWIRATYTDAADVPHTAEFQVP